MANAAPGTLYIVATPIGNLEDITFRAVRTLKEVDLIAAEDTRHSRKLLSHYGIGTRLTPYHDHNEQLKTDYLLGLLHDGRNLALITDAGTPAIADPGFRIVRAAVAAGFKVVPIPGPSALAAVVSAAGLPSDRIAFEGFLPPRVGKRLTKLRELINEPRLLVFYEAPHRLVATLEAMLETFGDREAVVAREVTKIHEEFRSGSLLELLTYYRGTAVKGEIAILLAPAATAPSAAATDPAELLRSLLASGTHSLKDAVKTAAEQSGISRSDLYQMALSIRSAIKKH